MPVVLIPTRDLFLQATKDFEGSTVPVEEVRRQVEDALAQEVASSPMVESLLVPETNQLRLARWLTPKPKRWWSLPKRTKVG